MDVPISRLEGRSLFRGNFLLAKFRHKCAQKTNTHRNFWHLHSHIFPSHSSNHANEDYLDMPSQQSPFLPNLFHGANNGACNIHDPVDVPYEQRVGTITRVIEFQTLAGGLILSFT